MKTCVALGFAFLLVLGTSAQTEPASVPPTGPAAALLASSCSGCHVNSEADNGFPLIHGLPSHEIREALLAFRSGESEGTVMNRIAKGYNDSEIQTLSDYFASQQPSAGSN